MRNLLFVMLLCLPIFAGNLQLQNGSVTAHTQMMWESIDPKNEKLYADVNIQDGDITSLRGKFWVDMKLFIVEKPDMDEHMHESIASEKFKFSTFKISTISKSDEKDKYTIYGILNFYGVDKELKVNATIISNDDNLTLNANSTIFVTDFGMETVCKFFMCVDDKIDFKVNATFK